MLNNKAKRIIENAYDIILETQFKEEAQKQMHKDLNNHNIAVDKNSGTIEIQDTNGNVILYTITIKQGK